ncbi:response regulator transcription factor [Rothia sp. (in: high G+C Gram-positive bacteria)]|uniref:response regulator transcription factor n=1 Tax=Rothia sp. (in: high G+C Gram-positive bacteria) TaxID=1885016 RepID=UPI000EBE8DBF|nr:DNA-binding response regulator [Rothia sp. (in: high G+C Gram-positive bacteria)]
MEKDTLGHPTQVSVVIVDDELFVRRALRAYLGMSSQITVVGEAKSGQEALELLKTISTDIVLMDLQMPDMDGIACTEKLVALYPEVKVLVITGHITDSYLTSALMAGASGYLVKDAEPGVIINAVLEVSQGGNPLDPQVASLLVERIRSSKPESDNQSIPQVDLTERERVVLNQLCLGKNTKEISLVLFVSEATVKHHLANLMRKFQVRDRVQLAICALKGKYV